MASHLGLRLVLTATDSSTVRKLFQAVTDLVACRRRIAGDAIPVNGPGHLAGRSETLPCTCAAIQAARGESTLMRA